MCDIRIIDKRVASVIVSFSFAFFSGCQDSRTGEAPSALAVAEHREPRPGLVAASNALKSETSDPDCCKTETPTVVAAGTQTPSVDVVAGTLTIPDVTLIDQDGQPVNLARDLAPGELVVINFIFTTCRGVCPPMGVNFGQLLRRLEGRPGREVHLVSISVDPVTDTPARLKAWGQQFGASRGWTLLTGPKQDVDRVLKALGVFTANKTEHSPFVLMGRSSEGRWRRIHGLTPADKLAEAVQGMLESPVSAWSPAQRYFTDVPLIDQHGRPVRLYSDILKGKVVVITPFFTSCRASCPRLIDTFARLQTHFEDRLGKDLYLVSLTVDPDTDKPEVLKAYAEQLHAGPGWYFLTGEKENVSTALSKLGQRIQAREDHNNIFIIGNEATGLWKKAMGLAPPEQIIGIVESVLNDKPS